MLNFFKKDEKLVSFWKTCLGETFLTSEAEIIHSLIPTLFGYHLLLLGEAAFLNSLSKSPIQHAICIQPLVEPETSKAEIREKVSALIAREDKLPIQTDAIDLIYLPHCLEFVVNPHEVLRESYRTLVPEGHLIVSCFNPWSLWGFCRRFFSFRKKVPWNGQFISVLRLKDWLALLGFDVVQCVPFFFRPPINHLGILKRLKWLETVGRWCWPFGSGAYVVLARKRTLTLTPIRPVFEIERKTVPGAAHVTAEFSSDRDSST